MTKIEASAPGKLVLLGEYAVLEGAPALVLAVDRRARVTLEVIAGATWHIESPTLACAAALRLEHAQPVWLGARAPELDWVAILLQRFASQHRLPTCRLWLDSEAFYFADGGTRSKLGLGSSAALTVALIGALHLLAGLPPPRLHELVHAHRAIQGGRGSGIDIAASLAGGLNRFELVGDTARLQPMQQPMALPWRCVYSGAPASTTAMLAAVADWRSRAPAAYTRQLRELATISGHGIDAVTNRDTEIFLASLNDFGNALARLGEAAGVEIASRSHRQLRAIAQACACTYKSCGAGGGDVGIAFATKDTPLQEFAARARAAGFVVLELAADVKGLLAAHAA